MPTVSVSKSLTGSAGCIADDYEGVSAVHIAAAGQYYLGTLGSQFQYLLRLIPDIPISDEGTLNRLKSIFMQFKSKPAAIPMEQAVACVEDLLNYLDIQEQAEHANGMLSRDPILSGYSIVSDMRVELEPQFTSIRRWLSRRDSK